MSVQVAGFTDVYYSNFWYSRYFRPTLTDFNGNIVKDEIGHNLRCLRLLALFFDQIYIPRSHLLTFLTPTQETVNHAIVNTGDFSFLRDSGVISVSSFPGIDAQQDNERIISRSSQTKHVLYPSDKQYIKSIPIDEKYVIDSSKESKRNTVTFPEYASLLAHHNPKLAQDFLEIVKSSRLKDLPFFHEEFMRRLRTKFDDEVFPKLWRETNSIYLTSGAVSSNCIAFFNEEIESLNFRTAPNDFDRYLFSPSSLYSFLGILLTDEEIKKILFAPIEKVLPLRNASADEQGLHAAFKSAFQVFCRGVSSNTRGTVVLRTLDQSVMRQVFELTLYDQFRKGSRLLESVMDDAEKLARIADMDGTGITAKILGAATKYGQSWWEAVSLRRRHPHISQFLSVLRGRLKGVTV